MLKVEEWIMIRHLLEKGFSKSAIAQELGIDRKTVRKYLKNKENPKYHRTQPYPSILDSFKEEILLKLGKYPKITAEKIYREIKPKGFSGSYRLIAEFVKGHRQSEEPQAFLRYETRPGEWAQVDWGEFGYIDYYGVKKKLYGFNMVLGYSRVQYTEFFISCNQQTLLRFHVHAFQYFGGIPEKILYDNPKAVVLEHIGDNIRWNPQFLDFASYYGFSPHACTPGKQGAHEKGKVERGIGYVRTSFFTGTQFNGLDDLNDKKDAWLDNIANKRIHGTTREVPFERLQGERKYLRCLPGKEYVIASTQPRNVQKDCYFCFGGNCYSVPWQYARKRVEVKALEKEIEVYFQGTLIAQHFICPFRGKYIRKDEHFRNLPRPENNRLKKYEDAFQEYGEAGKEFLRELVQAKVHSPFYHLNKIASLKEDYNPQMVAKALEHALRYKAFSYRTIRNILWQMARNNIGSTLKEVQITLCTRCEYELPDVEKRPLQYYDSLTKEGV